MKSFEIQDHPIDARPWWSRRRRMMLSLLFILAIFGSMVVWAYWRGSAALRNAIAEADSLDPNWRIEQLEANRAPIPEEENSALVIAAAKKIIDNSILRSQDTVNHEEQLEEIKRYPAARLNDEQLKAVTELMKPYRPALAEFSKVVNMPRGRFPIRYSPDFIGTLLNSQDAREGGRVFPLVLLERVAADDLQGAVDAIKGMINSARSVGDEPLLISILIRIACEAIAMFKVEWLLAQCQPTDAALSELQRMFEDDAAIQLLTLGLRGERGGSFELFEHMKANPGYVKSVGGAIWGPGAGGGNAIDFLMAYFPGSISVQQADLLKYMNQSVEISKLPTERHAGEYAQLSKQIPTLAFMARLLCPAIEKVAQAYTRRQAQLQCTITALAAERFRQKHGRWPNQLDELVKDGLLKSLSVDPFDGKPLRWKVTDQGRLVYSVGKDRIDNGGNFDPAKFNQDGYDMVFRLFDPDKRGQEPRPPKPKKTTEDGEPGSP